MKMNKEQKIEFINIAMDRLRESLLSKVDKMPEDWNGHELRWLIRDEANKYVWKNMDDKRSKRYKDYENTCIVKNI